MPTTTALPAKRRLARNIGEGYEVLLGKKQEDGAEAWGLVVDTLEICAPIAIVSMTVEFEGERVRLPGVPPTARLMSRRAAS